MPPHLHPRSRTTSTLFATTVAASFLVVGLPHILPCPAPRVRYADSHSHVVTETLTRPDGTTVTRRRRVKKKNNQDESSSSSSCCGAEVQDGMAQFPATTTVATTASRGGSESEEGEEDETRGKKAVVVTTTRSRRLTGDGTTDDDDATAKTERRECPVPKPGGIVGELMGFGKKGTSDTSTIPTAAATATKTTAEETTRPPSHDKQSGGDGT
ncbi:hypothetical protein F4778DRAFT_213073 [Xylariomycetidae sp. FL2044]|nr:hypothetical protein F4778DRAFT_213073 [Xylariomycetidae sp. FL2044]